jgi:uncharacterized membrane protein (DUF485 family)
MSFCELARKYGRWQYSTSSSNIDMCALLCMYIPLFQVDSYVRCFIGTPVAKAKAITFLVVCNIPNVELKPVE